MDGDADPDVDKTEGGYYQLTTEPSVKEASRLWDTLNDVLAQQSYLFASGVYLDYKAAEVGLTRRSATAATGEVTFTVDASTVVPSGTRLSTTSLTETDTPHRFATDISVVRGGTDGDVDVTVTATVAGSDGNVSAAAIDIIEDTFNGGRSVTNAVSMSGGTDAEVDSELRVRIALEIASPRGAGNIYDYIRWASSRDGVNVAVTVIPLWDGVNTVKVVILDNDAGPASQAVLDDVQEYLTGLPRLANPTTTCTAAAGAAGTLTGTYDYKITFTDGSGETKGSTASNSLAVTSKKIDLTAIPLGPTGTTERNIYRRIGSGKYFLVHTISDNTATTYTDDNAPTATVLPKTNNTTNSDGVAPIGAIVTVDTPAVVSIDVVATVTCETGYSLTGALGTVAIADAIEAALQEYIDSLAPGVDVVYRHVEAKFFTVTGVYDISGLTVEGGSSNVTIADDEVADLASPPTLT